MIAAGVIAAQAEPAAGEIVASADCTVTAVTRQAEVAIAAGIPQGAPTWPQPYDPGDHVPYAFDFAPLMAEDERIASIAAIRLGSQAAALGIAVDQAAGYAPTIDVDGGRKVQVWLLVSAPYQGDGQFDAGGVRMVVTFQVVTDALPPKRFERSAVLVVRQL